ncbi:sedoheptulose-1,7-bisphosphatase [Elsinoe ampelina]|uniref:fructose-bisphosphatase n=1 Tax=Elsinoe ampelina TaxID=302913 RepID=A0A6A6GCI2_9PEZI|nr:sedoheptulose-1,7-bisphosphatase [Elsinoe ampelina]
MTSMSPQSSVPAYPELQSFLESVLPDKRVALRTEVLPALIHSVQLIAETLRSSHQVSQVGTANAFGDDQLNVDVAAENIIREAIANSPSIAAASSEEDPVEKVVNQNLEGGEIYTIAFDPLDGSSIIAPNWSVGTIIGLWDGKSALNQSPDKQIAAILGVYGPRTTVVVAIRTSTSDSVAFELGINDGTCDIIRERIQLDSPPFKTRYFAPANLRSAAEDQKYMELVTHYIRNKYTLRYSGGLVPDIVHALVKGHGVYVSPVTEKSKAKLRRLYELAPIALIVECAGGKALDSKTGERILERQIKDCDERAGIVCGTTDEVDLVSQRLGLGA